MPANGSYDPKPIDTSSVHLPSWLEELGERLAENSHDIWARDRLADGWVLGPPPAEGAPRTHPGLVAYADLAENEKDYDRRNVTGTLKALVRLGCTIGRADQSYGEGPATAADAERVLAYLDSTQSHHAHGSLLGLWRRADYRAWTDRRPFVALAERLRSIGDLLVAYDVVRAGTETLPGDVKLRQLEALALADLGCGDEARAKLEELRKAGRNDRETIGILARVHKDLGLAAKGDERIAHLRRALALYGRAATQEESYWAGVNAATLALLLGRDRLARRQAAITRDQCRAVLERKDVGHDEPYWVRATLGEVALIEGNLGEACAWYREAVERAPDALGLIARSRKNARLIADHRGEAWEPIAAALPLPSVTVFAGHMIDRPDRLRPRFPTELEPRVRSALDQAIASAGNTIGYASAASGSDILFLEALHRHQRSAVVVLPYAPTIFCVDSVAIVRSGQWQRRFNRVCEWATMLTPVASQRLVWGGAEYHYANSVLLGLAKLRAQSLGTELRGLAVWDGLPGDGPGGTAGAVAMWKRYGVPWTCIDIARLRTGKPASARSRKRRASRRRPRSTIVRALLFADLEGYSKMKDRMVMPFLKHVIGLAADVGRSSARQFVGAESRGDGFFLTFATAAAAARFALSFNRQIKERDWREYDLPERLKMRIALHAGPVHRVRDPLTKRWTHTGTHVIKAARIEPKAPANQIWTSQEFAALAALEGADDFTCVYVGEVTLPKDFGRFPMYRLTEVAPK